MRPSSTAPIRVEGLVYGYGAGAFQLEIPALTVAPGECVVCIGPSGSGKTTFLHLLAGILLPRAGRVEVDGVDWAARDDAARRRARITRIGLVFQEFELLDHLTVRENILLPYYVNPALELDDAAEAAAAELAREAGIEGELDRRPRALSHGERQRAALCRALVTRPAVLLADEPTGNLDPDATASVCALLLREAHARGATLVMVTHDSTLLDRFGRVIDFAEFSR